MFSEYSQLKPFLIKYNYCSQFTLNVELECQFNYPPVWKVRPSCCVCMGVGTAVSSASMFGKPGLRE